MSFVARTALWLVLATAAAVLVAALTLPPRLTQSAVQYGCMRAAAAHLSPSEYARLAAVRYTPSGSRSGTVRFRLRAEGASAPALGAAPDYSGPRVFFGCQVRPGETTTFSAERAGP